MLGSCKGDDDPKNAYSLKITPSTTDVISFTGGSIDVTVESNGDWSVKSDQTWITFDPLRGSGNGSFKITAVANPNEEERSATITVSIEDSDVKEELTVKQGPKELAFSWVDEGKFCEKAVGVVFFWSAWSPDFAPATPSLYYEYELEVAGDLKFEFENSHIHTFIMHKQPGYYEQSTPGTLQWKSDFTVQPDPTIEEAFAAVKIDHFALCPRSKPQIFSYHLDAGTYWSVHTLENDVLTCKPDPDGPEVEQPGATGESFPFFEETYKLKVTFTPDK
jgi:hypothetical protein